MQNFASRRGRIVPLSDESSTDYTPVVPIFGDPKSLRTTSEGFATRRSSLSMFDSPKMERFVIELREAGWRVLASWAAKWHELFDVRHLAASLPFVVLLYTGVCFFSNCSVRFRWMVL